jgi:hypothetical protein
MSTDKWWFMENIGSFQNFDQLQYFGANDPVLNISINCMKDTNILCFKSTGFLNQRSDNDKPPAEI